MKDQINKDTEFRNWLRNIWVDNCLEHDEFGLPHYAMGEYFKKYKYWLKREYKFQKNKNAK